MEKIERKKKKLTKDEQNTQHTHTHTRTPTFRARSLTALTPYPCGVSARCSSCSLQLQMLGCYIRKRHQDSGHARNNLLSAHTPPAAATPPPSEPGGAVPTRTTKMIHLSTCPHVHDTSDKAIYIIPGNIRVQQHRRFPQQDSKGREPDRTDRERTEQDWTEREGTGRDGTGRDGTGRDGTEESSGSLAGRRRRARRSIDGGGRRPPQRGGRCQRRQKWRRGEARGGSWHPAVVLYAGADVVERACERERERVPQVSWGV